MAKCPKCESTLFSVENVAPNQSRYKLMFVVCARCNSTVGVMDYMNIGNGIEVLQKKLDSLEREIGTVESNVTIVNQNIGRLMNAVGTVEDKVQQLLSKK